MMASMDVVACAPFRLTAPRPLTPWEWRVVATAIETELSLRNLSAVADGPKLVAAIQNSPAASWRSSAYGPAPAVDTRLYAKLARWYASLAPSSRGSALADIANGSLLVGVQKNVWDTPAYDVAGDHERWEGSFQVVRGTAGGYAGPSSRCNVARGYTAYIPVSGRQLIEIVKRLQGGAALSSGFDPVLQAAPALFLDRSFLLGVVAKQSVDLGTLAGSTSGTMAQAASALFHDVALIWAPQRGASLMPLLGGLAPAAVSSLLLAMGADLAGGLGLPAEAQSVLTDILRSPWLEQALPGLLQQYTGGSNFGPSSRFKSGFRVVDQTGDELEKAPPPPLPKGAREYREPFTGWDLMGLVAFVAAVGIAHWMSRQPLERQRRI